ncbi:hypothetical protein, partial [Burkholderia sp. AU4i]|uniref:hypothetical protein n=1 Tax=Burkholderia sp. AU4i TaxID=1335308 RepID=UPI001C54DEE5
VRTIVDDGVDQVLTISFDQRGVVHGRAGLSSGVSDEFMLPGEPSSCVFNLQSETYERGVCAGRCGIFCCAPRRAGRTRQ